jgi:magnesium transporter
VKANSPLAHESTHSLGRLLTFLNQIANERKEDKLLKARIRTAARNIVLLADHVSHLSNKIVFLLGATLDNDQHRAEQHHQDFLDRLR